MESYLIWSFKHGAWWRPHDEMGYTTNIEEAGRYSRGQAKQIEAGSSVSVAITLRLATSILNVAHQGEQVEEGGRAEDEEADDD